MITRRTLALLGLLGSALLATPPSFAADQTIRIGFQKYGTLILLKARGTLEDRLKGLGYTVSWTEFPAGPQLLEAMNAGAVDLGATGETPPIFAQAAGTKITYVANEPPAPRGEAILVKADGPIRSLADLKGRTVALNKGSNVHYLLVRALEKAGLSYGDIKPVFLAPADGRAAFEAGEVDAWAIWDPFFAAAETAGHARVLTTGEGLVPNVQFYLANRDFAKNNAKALDAVVAALDETDRWAAQNGGDAAQVLSAAIRVPAPIIATALGRQSYGVSRVTADVVRDQQLIADTFFKLHIVPKAVSIADALSPAGE